MLKTKRGARLNVVQFIVRHLFRYSGDWEG